MPARLRQAEADASCIHQELAAERTVLEIDRFSLWYDRTRALLDIMSTLT